MLDGARHKTQEYRGRGGGCGKRFSVRVDTLLAASNAGLRKWAVAVHLMVANLKGVSSKKPARDLGVSQKTAWLMVHRIREVLDSEQGEPFSGPVESDETRIGGKAKNMHAKRREEVVSGRGASGKVAVVGVKDTGPRTGSQPVLCDLWVLLF